MTKHSSDGQSFFGSRYKSIYSSYLAAINHLVSLDFCVPSFAIHSLPQSIIKNAYRQMIYDFALDHPVFPKIFSHEINNSLANTDKVDIATRLLSHFRKKNITFMAFLREFLILLIQSGTTVLAQRTNEQSLETTKHKAYVYPNRSSVQCKAMNINYLKNSLPTELILESLELVPISHNQIPLDHSISTLTAIYLFAKAIIYFLFLSVWSLLNTYSMPYRMLREISIARMLGYCTVRCPIILFGAYDTYRPLWSYQSDNKVFFLMHSDGLIPTTISMPTVYPIQLFPYNTLDFLHFHSSSAQQSFLLNSSFSWQSHYSLQNPIAIQSLFQPSSSLSTSSSDSFNEVASILEESRKRQRKVVLLLDVPPRREFIFTSYYYNPQYLSGTSTNAYPTVIPFLDDIIKSLIKTCTVIIKSKPKPSSLVQPEYLDYLESLRSTNSVYITDSHSIYELGFDAAYALPYTSALHIVKTNKKYFYDPHSVVMEPWTNYFNDTRTKLLRGKLDLLNYEI